MVWWFHGKDGVAGSIPAGGSTPNHQLRPDTMPGRLHAQRTPNRRLPEICQKTPSVVVRTPHVAPGLAGPPRAAQQRRRQLLGEPGSPRPPGWPSQGWCGGSGRPWCCRGAGRRGCWPHGPSAHRSLGPGCRRPPSQVAKECRKSCAPRRSTASRSGSPGGTSGDQRRAGPRPSAAARPHAASSPRAVWMVVGRMARPWSASATTSSSAVQQHEQPRGEFDQPQLLTGPGGLEAVGDGGHRRPPPRA
jgi:hypothetical protein